MTAITPDVPVGRRPRSRDQQSFSASRSRDIQAMGLMTRRRGYYGASIVGAVARGGRTLDAVIGGPNLQIEHHVFPSMPMPNPRRAAPVVQAFGERHGVTHTQAGLVESYGTVVRHPHQVGLGARDPFECPLVQTYRPA